MTDCCPGWIGRVCHPSCAECRRMEAQFSISSLSLHALLRNTFTFTFTAVLMMIQAFWDVTPCRLANVYQSTLYKLRWYFNHKISYLLQVYGNILTTDAVKCPVGWGEGMRGVWVGFSRRCPRSGSDYHIGPGKKTVNTPTRFTHETTRLLTICLMNASPPLCLYESQFGLCAVRNRDYSLHIPSEYSWPNCQ